MKKITIILMAVTNLLIFSDCAYSEKEISKNVCILVDFSQSTKNNREDYKEALESIFKQIKMGDHIFIWKITEISEMERKPLMDKEFTPEKEPPNDFWRKQAAIKMRKNIDESKNNTIKLISSDNELSRKTAIFDALNVAERVFKKYRKDKLILIIMSDMIEDSRYNFEMESLSEDRISQIISSQNKQDLLPDLNGAKVYVVGASTAQGMQKEKYNYIQKFWLRYFKECRAESLKENYGSALIGFDE